MTGTSSPSVSVWRGRTTATRTRSGAPSPSESKEVSTQSSSRIQVDESSLYPALYRMEKKGLLASEWGRSELDRRAKFYRLTPKGRKELQKRTSEWAHFADAVSTVLLDGA